MTGEASEMLSSPVKEKVPVGGGPLLVFGQGPVIDTHTREKPDVNTQPGNETINLWSENLAEAAAELYKRGQTNKIIIMGGRTGGPDFLSESELIANKIKQQLQDLHIPSDAIQIEDQSLDTIANIFNLLNMLDRHEISGDSFQILGAPYHLSRLKLIMQIFEVPYTHAFSSIEITRMLARDSGDPDQYDHKKLIQIQRMLNIDNPSYFDDFKGVERQSYRDRALTDDAFMARELIEYPEVWLSRLPKMENSERRLTILKNLERRMPGHLEQYNINLQTDTVEEICKKLSQIHYSGLSDEIKNKWKKENPEKGWSQRGREILEQLVNERQQ